MRLRIVLLLVLAAAVLALLIGPLAKPPFLAIAEDAKSQTLLSNVFDGFIAPFNQQAKALGLLAALALAISFIWQPAARQLQSLGIRKSARAKSNKPPAAK